MRGWHGRHGGRSARAAAPHGVPAAAEAAAHQAGAAAARVRCGHPRGAGTQDGGLGAAAAVPHVPSGKALAAFTRSYERRQWHVALTCLLLAADHHPQLQGLQPESRVARLVNTGERKRSVACTHVKRAPVYS